MKRIVFLVVLLLTLLSVGHAFAKDLCVQNAFGQLLKFNNVKLLKGKTTVFAGQFFNSTVGGDANFPLTGVVTVDSDNVTTRIGILTFPNAGGGVPSAVGWSMVGDKLFNATGNFDNAPFSGNDGADTWGNVSCTSVPAASLIPPIGPVPGLP